jgi:hypothetical protein
MLALVALVLLPTACRSTSHGSAPTDTVTVTKSAVPLNGQQEPQACARLTIGPDGNFGPAICPDGHPNSAAVDKLRDAGYVTIDLDPNATPSQVTAALCADNATLTNPLRLTLYRTAAALNRWNFAIDVVDSIGELSQRCPPRTGG